MPDKRKHRGRHPQDEQLFAEDRLPLLRIALQELDWLLTRRYGLDSALQLVGNHHDLTARQRMALRRCSCPAERLAQRLGKRVPLAACEGASLAIDGYNLLITLESALGGGLVLVGRDGCYRDLASVHGTYRKVEETLPAIELIIDTLSPLNAARIDWYLDRPVSNSGRLKKLIAETIESRLGVCPEHEGEWNIELVDSPDRLLSIYDGIIVTTDSAILDRGGSWINLAAEIIDACVADAWKVSLNAEA